MGALVAREVVAREGWAAEVVVGEPVVRVDGVAAEVVVVVVVVVVVEVVMEVVVEVTVEVAAVAAGAEAAGGAAETKNQDYESISKTCTIFLLKSTIVLKSTISPTLFSGVAAVAVAAVAAQLTPAASTRASSCR